jgi:hypothetical protein
MSTKAHKIHEFFVDFAFLAPHGLSRQRTSKGYFATRIKAKEISLPDFQESTTCLKNFRCQTFR